MTVTFPAVGSKGDGTRIQALVLADRCTESSSGTVGGKPEVCFDCRLAKLSAVKRAVLFYRLKLRALFFRII